MLLVGSNLFMGKSICLMFDIQWPPNSDKN
jgi:hypothetical protein